MLLSLFLLWKDGYGQHAILEQALSINDQEVATHPDALLDLSAADQPIIVSRLTQDSINKINNCTGGVVYNLDSLRYEVGAYAISPSTTIGNTLINTNDIEEFTGSAALFPYFKTSKEVILDSISVYYTGCNPNTGSIHFDLYEYEEGFNCSSPNDRLFTILPKDVSQVNFNQWTTFYPNSNITTVPGKVYMLLPEYTFTCTITMGGVAVNGNAMGTINFLAGTCAEQPQIEPNIIFHIREYNQSWTKLH